MNYLSLLYKLNSSINLAKKHKQKINKIQNKRLRKLLLYAYNNSKYYHNVFEENGINSTNINKLPISRFPKLDKQVLMENFDDLITVNDITQKDLKEFDLTQNDKAKRLKGKYHVVHSSGSTGEPRYFLYDNNAWNSMLVGIIRSALWGMNMKEVIKIATDNPRILYIAATDGRYGGSMSVSDGVGNLKAKQLQLDINNPLDVWISKIKEFNPNIIIGYPSAIKIISMLQRDGEFSLNVKRIVSCGEPLDINLRNILENRFKCDVVNFYGASESIAMGAEVTGENAITLFDDLNLVEIEENEIYLTCLYNYAQPIIRYKLTDKLKEKESSNTGFTQIENIIGRSEDILWFDNNGKKEFLHPLAIEGFCIEGLVDYQFVKKGKKSLEMIAEVKEDKDEPFVEQEMKKQMKNILHENNLDFIDFKVNFEDRIMHNEKTGKKKLVVILDE